MDKVNLHFNNLQKTNWSFGGPDTPAPTGYQNTVPVSTDASSGSSFETPQPFKHLVAKAEPEKPSVVYTMDSGLRDAERDASLFSVSLPSEFYFYPFKQLSVRQVTGRHQAKFNKAASEENPRYLVEGVSSLLGDDISAYDLTPQDFFWLLYWILFVSYPERTTKTTVVCRDHKHNEDVAAGVLEPHTLNNLLEYRKPILVEKYLEVAKVAEFKAPELAKRGIVLKPFTMRDAIQWEEEFKDSEDSELFYLAELAVNIEGGTIAERSEVIANLPAKALDEIKLWKEITTDYGVVASVKSKCKECGAVTEIPVSVAAHDFL